MTGPNVNSTIYRWHLRIGIVAVNAFDEGLSAEQRIHTIHADLKSVPARDSSIQFEFRDNQGAA